MIKYLGKSRIDGKPIYEIPKSESHILSEFNLKIEIIRQLIDNLSYPNGFDYSVTSIPGVVEPNYIGFKLDEEYDFTIFYRRKKLERILKNNINE
jgi:hypothetical protein